MATTPPPSPDLIPPRTQLRNPETPLCTGHGMSKIPLRLGVSKAILENVVFCHQEDSSWPLQEGAVVKKKFDDIFESARYTKALDTIKKTKQEYAATVKVGVRDLSKHKRLCGCA